MSYQAKTRQEIEAEVKKGKEEHAERVKEDIFIRECVGKHICPSCGYPLRFEQKRGFFQCIFGGYTRTYTCHNCNFEWVHEEGSGWGD